MPPIAWSCGSPAGRLVGRTEADVAREVRDALVEEGHETAQFAIVASGPNSASPHHEASDRIIGPGEPIVLDIGGTLEGYGSRYHADAVGDRWRRHQGTGRAVPPPVRRPPRRPRPRRPPRSGRASPARRSTGQRERRSTPRATARRSSIAPATGSASTATRIPTSSPATISRCDPGWRSASSPGSTSTGRYGARIEDIVVCGEDGPIVLNEAPRELTVVDG